MKGQYSVAVQNLNFEPPENPSSEHDGLFVSKPLLSMSRSIATSFELYPSNFTIITSAHASSVHACGRKSYQMPCLYHITLFHIYG